MTYMTRELLGYWTATSSVYPPNRVCAVDAIIPGTPTGGLPVISSLSLGQIGLEGRGTALPQPTFRTQPRNIFPSDSATIRSADARPMNETNPLSDVANCTSSPLGHIIFTLPIGPNCANSINTSSSTTVNGRLPTKTFVVVLSLVASSLGCGFSPLSSASSRPSRRASSRRCCLSIISSITASIARGFLPPVVLLKPEDRPERA
mmetsp:Transcript_9713/g.39321  ORF Transcript_9713/g.39321 Transcript_9713/m.39321 type:complete len:205 (+) Transcript_9713:830-1444(+)